MQPKISVILPCWQSNEFFDRLYECIQAQTFKDAEWIFVNDGDASQNEKLQAMAEKDPTIRVIWKENGGVSSARNMGIDEAKGEWIVFIDPDDLVRPYYLESLYSAVMDSDADMAVGGYTEYITLDNVYSSKFINIDESIVKSLDAKNALLKIINSYIIVFPWNKIYKASIIKENNLKFDLSVRVIQDGVFNCEYFCYCKKISLVKDCGYIYDFKEGTSLATRYDPNYGRDCIRFLNGLKNVLTINGFSPDEVDNLMTNPGIRRVLQITLNSFKRNHPPFKQTVKEIREYVLQNEELMLYAKKYKKNNKLGLGEKYIISALSTRSAVVVYLMLKPVFWLRYKSPKFYVRLKSLIYGRRQK